MENQQRALDIVHRALGARPVAFVRHDRFSDSGNTIYRVLLASGQSVALRMNPRPHQFTFTRHNLDVLRSLELPVQQVLAMGSDKSSGSFIILNWIRGRDLVDELGSMSRPQMTRVAQQIVGWQRRVSALPRGRRFGWGPLRASGSLETWSEAFGAPCDQPDERTLVGSLQSRLCRVRIQLESYLASIRPTCFLDDLSCKNVLVENGVLRGIIDVDTVCYGDPLLTVGAALAVSVSNMVESAEFYFHELMRFWRPDPIQHRAIHFYAALWLVGSLGLPDASVDPARALRLADTAIACLNCAEDETSASINYPQPAISSLPDVSPPLPSNQPQPSAAAA